MILKADGRLSKGPIRITDTCAFDFSVIQTRLDISYIGISCERYRKADYLEIGRHVCKHMWNMDRSLK